MDTNLMLAYLGVALMVILSGVGSSIGITISGKAVVGGMKKDPTQMGKYIGLAALPSSQGLYGFVGFFLVQSKIFEGMSTLAAWAILGAGVALGVLALISAIRQSQVCAEGIAGVASGHNVLVPSMVMAVFPELYAILGLLVAILTFLALPSAAV
ncbi:ATPase [Porphyromonas cangingivalis]|uniref:ATPase n=1 Tax=Porphyromonas cangingivalis TaxID=36874 RepID=A0A099WSA4_PORCN|nr:ATPase [Porphyromonas cangingivalis]KGL47388.1 ATPase [Porphyromonas cangingivalis]KGN83231.1 ATPase [Porphyromonas cangingivalis]SJZ59577.1 V/A-type H+-transporting ATPase subunit K [Porphyromonas cangingivalis]SPY34333.1 Sodium ATPase proteolipid component [Porphyromonas cangingivalis]VEJ01892.1 Sodium ATPase proteolipid component [Porphyromonas cangingivalis]